MAGACALSSTCSPAPPPLCSSGNATSTTLASLHGRHQEALGELASASHGASAFLTQRFAAAASTGVSARPDWLRLPQSDGRCSRDPAASASQDEHDCISASTAATAPAPAAPAAGLLARPAASTRPDRLSASVTTPHTTPFTRTSALNQRQEHHGDAAAQVQRGRREPDGRDKTADEHSKDCR